MLFNSLPFLLFLPAVFALYWLGGRRIQNALLLLASYFFYGWWDWRFIGLIVLSSAVDYVAGQRIHAGRHRSAWLGLSLSVNLGALGLFKYLDWGIESMAALLSAVGLEPHLPTLGLLLPVGISFYTFQTLSYTLDIYRGKFEPTRDPLAFFAFVAFFPQLVAGPIERATSLLPQFLRPRAFDARRAADGCRQILYGLLVKTVVADNLAPYVDQVYAAPGGESATAVLLATYAFAFQIYGDFAGYSHVAIGCARLFGFSLRRNFAYPYLARSPAEFWHRWHMSLSTWFRDYVYVPLGGGRVPRLRRAMNVLVTFVTSGIWHGAGFTFLVWGIFHGLLVSLQWWDPRTEIENPMARRGHRRLGDWLAVLVTFHLVCLGWVLFRAADLGTAGTLLRTLTSGSWIAPASSPALAWFLVIPPFVLLEWIQRRRPHPFHVDRMPTGLKWTAGVAVVWIMVILGRIDSVPFIYFQF